MHDQPEPKAKDVTLAQPSTLPSFNPSKDERVDKIKGMTEELFAYLRASVPDNRCRSIAITNYEQAAMWAVKACFT